MILTYCSSVRELENASTYFETPFVSFDRRSKIKQTPIEIDHLMTVVHHAKRSATIHHFYAAKNIPASFHLKIMRSKDFKDR